MKKAAALVLALAAAGGAAFLLRKPAPPDFERDVAPVLRARCGACHRPDGGAPFPLLDYEDVKARAEQVADVARRRIMPPWPPERGDHAFRGDRSLPEAEIDLLERWARAGAPGRPSEPFRPPPILLEREDLRVSAPEAFELPAGGPDVYRNFVLPLPIGSRQAVAAWRFDPGPTAAVHHAFVLFDRTGEAARLDALDPAPGFPGLHAPRGAESPAGHFMSWQPGAAVRRSDDYPWALEPGSALVIQAHLRPTGKPERVRPSVAFTFGERVSELQPRKIALWNYEIDIPPDAPAHQVRDSFTLPVDVDVLGLLPHAHFLATRMEATARRPDGTSTVLLRIPRWNFDWQGDYAYEAPVFLPKGTSISMEWTYDNRASNPRNPHSPPKRVRYGVESADEMAELTLRVLPREPGGAAKLEEASAPRVLRSGVTYNRYLLAKEPENGRAHLELAKALLLLGRVEEAAPHLADAIRLRPEDDEPHYFLGLSRRIRRRPEEALAAFRAAVRLNPSNAKAHGNIGLVLMEGGQFDAAVAAFETALSLNPADDLARRCLSDIARLRKR